uniref:Uncharacterized protein n=2 Tax=Oryza sativa subsp. japonica TaxID=39947 RepID=Q6YSX2_ORYSJ|nr:hypothetical protein [Oryza sativa Japonica Group]BAD32003.1 hypothetical protein [Oryza sativa Japonica Group]
MVVESWMCIIVQEQILVEGYNHYLQSLALAVLNSIFPHVGQRESRDSPKSHPETTPSISSLPPPPPPNSVRDPSNTNAGAHVFVTMLLTMVFTAAVALALVNAVNSHDFAAHLAGVDCRMGLAGPVRCPASGFVELLMPALHVVGCVLAILDRLHACLMSPSLQLSIASPCTRVTNVHEVYVLSRIEFVPYMVNTNRKPFSLFVQQSCR